MVVGEEFGLRGHVFGLVKAVRGMVRGQRKTDSALRVLPLSLFL